MVPAEAIEVAEPIEARWPRTRTELPGWRWLVPITAISLALHGFMLLLFAGVTVVRRQPDPPRINTHVLVFDRAPSIPADPIGLPLEEEASAILPEPTEAKVFPLEGQPETDAEFPSQISIKMFPDGLRHDFGKVPQGLQLKHTFRVVNTTNVLLKLLSLRCS